MEGAVSNLLSPGDRVLIGTAGKFGERWVQLVESVRHRIRRGRSSLRPPGSHQRNEEASRNRRKFRAVFIQATESSTGVRNDVEALGKIVSALPEYCFVVDAITGLGTTDILPDDWGIDIMIGGSQKATMIPPGLAFASVSEKAWKTIEQSKLPRYYFDYAKERKTLAKGESSYTPAASLVVTLHDALIYIKQLGRENLIANAALLAEATREAAIALGLDAFCGELAGQCGDLDQRTGGNWVHQSRQGYARAIRRDPHRWPGHDEGPHVPHRRIWAILIFSISWRCSGDSKSRCRKWATKWNWEAAFARRRMSICGIRVSGLL